MNISLLGIGYLAGIIDGEGCITFNSKRLPYVYLKVSVGSTDKRTIEHIQYLLGLIEIYPKIGEYKPRPSQHRTYYDISIQDRIDVKRLLTVLRPYLITKKKQCEIGLEILEKGPTQELIDALLALRTRIKK